MISAVLHNIGQLAAAAATSSAAVFAYLPALVASGLVTGLFTGLCAQYALLHIGKIGFFKKNALTASGSFISQRTEDKNH
jgi:heptaprenyl diphosphate synthase